jgi:hypothetical protein
LISKEEFVNRNNKVYSSFIFHCSSLSLSVSFFSFSFFLFFFFSVSFFSVSYSLLSYYSYSFSSFALFSPFSLLENSYSNTVLYCLFSEKLHGDTKELGKL